jgi:alpha-L-fucosidase
MSKQTIRILLGSATLLAALVVQFRSLAAEAFPPPLPEAMKNWQAQRFGMFIHWGPVSLTAKEIGWSRGAQTPIEVYDNLYKQFNPAKFNADEWVSVAKAGGMKYMVLTTKHHDGFCLWDTKLTDYNIMNSPFRRDVVKELAAACKKQGIGFGTYYSVCDWHHPDFPLTSPGGSVERAKSDLDAYNRYLLGQVSELITNYGPLFTLWNDVPQHFEGRGVNTIKLARRLQPDIIINDRTGDGGDYSTPEQHIGGFNLQRPWESCMTISAHDQWAWGGTNDGVKPLAACLRMLIGAAGGDGNLLLNVGPRPDGLIDPEQTARIKEIGDWLAKYGESIYGTRGGPWKPGQWGASTRKGNRIYVHVFKWNGDTLELPAVAAGVKAAKALTGGSVQIKQTDSGITLTLAAESQAALDTLIALDLDKPAMDLPAVSVRVGKPGVQVTASNVYQNQEDYSADKAFDGDPETRWATDAGTKQAWLEVDLGKPTTFSRVAIDEWGDGGKRIQSFELQYQSDNGWKTFYRGATVGAKWEKSFDPMEARRIRLNIIEATEGPTINELQIK